MAVPQQQPSFLAHDPYASDLRHIRPTSSTSTATNATDSSAGIPSITGPVGEPGLPPSRPSAGTSGVAGTSSGPDRMSLPPHTRKGRDAFGGAKSPTIETEAAASDARPTSRTHVPSLVSQGFSRPMSSQKLQAQRSQRADVPSLQHIDEPAGSGWPGQERRTMRSHRSSNASVNTLRDGRPPVHDGEVPPLPPSRGTITSRDGHGQAEVNQAGSVRTHDSQTPLRGSSHPAGVSSGTSHLPTDDEQTPRSPMSLRAPFGLGSRTNKQDVARRSNGLHEKLNSRPPSLRGTDKSVPSPQHPAARSVSGRNYEYFAGNSLFCCFGRLMNTRAWPLSAASLTIIILPPALFFGFSAPWLWRNVSPAIPIFFAYFFYITLSSFLHAALTDSGILPRNLHPHPPNVEEERDPLALGPPTTEWVMVKTFSSQVTLGERGIPTGTATAMEVPTKYCKTCNIWRPPRTHHCRICDACIETQDHHCVWINNCVGRRNYRCFFSFIGTATILCILLIAFELTHVALYGQQHGISFGASLTGRTQERVAFALFIIALVALPYPGSLFVYHVFLVMRGETTREYLNTHKFPPKDRHRPFTQATSLRNYISVLFRPRPPTSLQLDRRYQEGDVRLGHLVRKRERRRDLKTRYSTPARRAKRPGEVEMEKLPPDHTAGGVASTLSGPMNSTPR